MFVQVGLDGREILACQVCVDVTVHLVPRETVAWKVGLVHKVHPVSLHHSRCISTVFVGFQ